MPSNTLVIIPAYNEEANIESVVRSLQAEAPWVDYLVINDCSTDNTAAICQKNGYPLLNLPINLGIGGVVQAGYRYALHHCYQIAIQMDGDGQHDARYIKNMIQPILDGKADLVVGSRFIQKEGFQSSNLRRFGIRYFQRLLRIFCGYGPTDATSGFRACNERLIKLYARYYSQDYPEPEAIVVAIRSGCKVMEVPVIMRERQGGISSIRKMKTIYYMIKVTLAVLIQSIAPGPGRVRRR